MAQPFHVAGAAAEPLFGRRGGSTNLIRDFFHKALSTMDLGRAEHALTIWNLVHSVTPNLIDLIHSVRHWIRAFFTSAVTVTDNDELHGHVLGWLEAKQLRSRFTREYTAQTNFDVTARRTPGQRRPGFKFISYNPKFNAMWFFYRWNLLVVTRKAKHASSGEGLDRGYWNRRKFDTPPKKAKETMTITCLGWSINPIRNFFQACEEMAEAHMQNLVPVEHTKGGSWHLLIMKPFRPLDTIYLEEDVKKKLLGDIEKYLDPDRRRFYHRNGIPYRRGYLLHGPPGCGKSSLSLALAGHFGLPLFVVDCTNVSDIELTLLFSELPTYCIVLLEDIDVFGFRRPEDDTGPKKRGGACSLSCLLNVLDGVASQEGRVVIMTTNLPDQLDPALVRPGRIDMKVYMGHITQQGAEAIFLRLMKTGRLDETPTRVSEDPERTEGERTIVGVKEEDGKADGYCTDEELVAHARQFSRHVPEGVLTPAQLQGFLLQHLHSVAAAMDGIADFVTTEKTKLKETQPRKEAFGEDEQDVAEGFLGEDESSIGIDERDAAFV